MFNFGNPEQYSLTQIYYSFSNKVQEQQNSNLFINQPFQQLLKKYQLLKTQNQELKQTISNISMQRNNEQLGKIKKTKKIHRRKENQLQKQYHCPYQKCVKQYASKLALNLHMKSKHNGGSQRQRDEMIEKIVKAQQYGFKRPRVNINIPISYIQSYREKFNQVEKQIKSNGESDSQYQC